MHYLGFVFVDEPTKEKVEEVMVFYKDDEWDYYRCGGRWDGYLQGEEEQRLRETNNGFNFGDRHDQPSRNCVRVADLPEGKEPYFFVTKRYFVAKTYYNRHDVRMKDGKLHVFEGEIVCGGVVETPYWEERYKQTLEAYKDKWIVVVDAHN